MQETDELGTITRELIAVTRDQEYPAEFREEIRGMLLDVREEIERMILLYS